MSRPVNIRTLDLNLLLTFTAVMSERQVSRAATLLGKSQSAVSHALSRLRYALDDDLFVRTPSGMVPTAKAEELNMTISKCLGEIENALRANSAFDPFNCDKTFKLGIVDYHAANLLPPLIEILAAEAPNINLNVYHISVKDPPEAQDKMLDCAVMGPVRNLPTRFRTRELMYERFICAASWSNRSISDAISLEDYLGLSHLQVSTDGSSGGIVDRELAKMGLSRRVFAIIPYYLLAPYLIRSSELVVTMSEGALRNFVQPGQVRLFTPPLDLPAIPVTMVYNRETEDDPARRWFRSVVERTCELAGKGSFYESSPVPSPEAAI